MSYEITHKIENNTNYKMCNICEEWFILNSDNFYKNKSTSDGYNPYCKKCSVKKAIKYEYEHYEKLIQSQINYNKQPERKQKMRERAKEQKSNGYYKQYQTNNMNKFNEYSEKRQHKNHKITVKEWKACKEYFNNCCAYCGLPIEEHYMTYRGQLIHSDLHKEHVIYNGENDLSNCVPSCKNCNSQKWEFSLEEWYNKDNPIYSKDRLDKIKKWINEDYKQYIRNNNNN